MAKRFLFLFLLLVVFLPLQILAAERPSRSHIRSFDALQLPDTPEFPPIKKAEFIHFPKENEKVRRPRVPRRSSRRRRSTATPSPTPQPFATVQPTSTPTPTPVPTPTPPPLESACPNPLTCNEFGLTGLRWSDPNGVDNQGIPYAINANIDATGLSSGGITQAFSRSFAVWEQANAAGLLRYQHIGTTSSAAGTQDFQNTISSFDFRRINRYRGALAVTSIWYRADTREIIEFDIAFNSGVPWNINAMPIGCSEYPIDTCQGDSSSYDLENVAVHEIGHTFMLADLGSSNRREMTMYGSARRGELKKRTLGLGDITGLNLLYP